MNINETIEVNKKQKEFYNTKKKNLPTRIWSKIRHGLLANIRKEIGISNQVYALHKNWLADISSKKVLDLGCFSGNNLSLYLAENAKEYVAIDLSDVGINILKERIKKYQNAKAVAADFLSEKDFPDKDFDIIYAYGVLHHFKNVDMLIKKLNDKLATNGIIISYDPLKTNFAVNLFRKLYRPFQSDKEWEWPFTRKTFYKFKNNFTILDKHGVLGKTKYFFLLNFLPISTNKKLQIGREWHLKDWNNSKTNENTMFNCMHLTMKMQKK